MLRKIFVALRVPIILLFGYLVLSTNACKEFEPSDQFYISTDSIIVTSESHGKYEFSGSILNLGEASISEHGFCWSEFPGPGRSQSTTKLGAKSDKGVFKSNIDQLKAATIYYVRAYAVTSQGTHYGSERSFTTVIPTIPTVTTGDVIHIKRNSAESGGNVTDEGAAQVTLKGICWGTLPKPTIENKKTIDGAGLGLFTSEMQGFVLDTTYYVRAYATNSEGTAYGNEVAFNSWSEGDFADFDDNVYSIVVIGDQTWMKENLRVTHFADGTPIKEVVEDSDWNDLSLTSKAYCWFDNNMENSKPYGALYTWGTAMNGEASSDQNPSDVQGVCPDGWHLPSDTEWQEMELYLGIDPAEADSATYSGRGEGIGGKLKEIGITHWRNPNSGANNFSGFNAVGAGSRNTNGRFSSFRTSCSFMTSTEFSPTNTWQRRLRYMNSYIYREYRGKNYTVSVRCVKDE